ncbi:hypothetical protein F4779DRAFT_480540 [Xylariaceae sp. FL0662B]|nr:hypothetical protein F4779DRAFT_480540 [Xylariaceae sp. FL0662B]
MPRALSTGSPTLLIRSRTSSIPTWHMGFRYTRAGDSQLPALARGWVGRWVYGTDEFQLCLASSVLTLLLSFDRLEPFQFRLVELKDYLLIRRTLFTSRRRSLGSRWHRYLAKIVMLGDDGNWTLTNS